MPWEFLLGYAATKVLDKTIDTVLFSERYRTRFSLSGIAEKYLKLSAEQLLAFYHKEKPLEIALSGRRYVLPMSMVLDPSAQQKAEICCETMPGIFSVPEKFIAYTDPVKKVLAKDKKSFDGRVVRLANLDQTKLFLQEASYYEGVATNFAIDHCPKGRLDSFRELVHGNSGSFGDLEMNPLVNHLGVVCMVETVDGMLVVQKRSRNVTNRGGTLSSSVSGAINWTDIRTKTSPFSINGLVESTFRETIEELGISSGDEIVFLGLLREFLRGGKPELYFFARTEEPFGKVRAKWRQAEGRKESTDIMGFEYHSLRVGTDELSRDGFKARVRQLMDKTGNTANLTLTAGVALTTRYILDRTF